MGTGNKFKCGVGPSNKLKGGDMELFIIKFKDAELKVGEGKKSFSMSPQWTARINCIFFIFFIFL